MKQRIRAFFPYWLICFLACASYRRATMFIQCLDLLIAPVGTCLALIVLASPTMICLVASFRFGKSHGTDTFYVATLALALLLWFLLFHHDYIHLCYIVIAISIGTLVGGGVKHNREKYTTGGFYHEWF